MTIDELPTRRITAGHATHRSSFADTRGKLTSKFVAYRVRPAEKHTKGKPPGDEQWLLCEWQSRDSEPRFHFSTLPAHLSLKELVRITKLRWRVERDYQDLKGEVGLDHFEGRTWRGFHRHATLCAVAHGFLALRRALFPPIQDQWTLPQVRRELQQLLLERIGWCPLCARPFRTQRSTRSKRRREGRQKAIR